MQTTLDVINDMLASTGTAPLTSNDTKHPAYSKALRKLTIVSRDFQSVGWWFNKAKRTLRQDVNGLVVLPANCLSADPTDVHSALVSRKGRIFDIHSNTYIIGKDVEVDMVDHVDLEDLPPAAARYLRSMAVFSYFLDEGGDANRRADYARMVERAEVALKKEQLRNQDINYFDGKSYRQHTARRTPRRLPR